MTKAFCKRTGVKSVIRSHQLPKKQRGFEIAHNRLGLGLGLGVGLGLGFGLGFGV